MSKTYDDRLFERANVLGNFCPIVKINYLRTPGKLRDVAEKLQETSGEVENTGLKYSTCNFNPSTGAREAIHNFQAIMACLVPK